MTATRKIKSLAPSLLRRKAKRQEHRVGSDKDSQAALQRFAAGVRTRRGGRPQRIIASEVGISKQQYCNIETGRNWPSMPVYLKICRVLRIALPGLLK